MQEKLLDLEKLQSSVDKQIAGLEVTLVLGVIALASLLVISEFVLPGLEKISESSPRK